MNTPVWLQRTRAKLLLSFSVLVTAIAIFVSTFFPARLEHQAMRLTVAKAEAVRDMAAYTLSAALFFSDTASVQEVVSRINRTNNGVLLVVRDKTGNPIAMRAEDSLLVRVTNADAGFREKGSLYVTSGPVRHGNAVVGTVSLVASLAKLEAEVAAAKVLGLVVGAIIMLVGLAIVYAISTVVTRPLLAVSDTVRRIAEGDLSLRAAPTSDADVGQFVNGFNDMVDRLVGAQSELFAINQELEARVDRRTAELSEAILDQRWAQDALTQSEAQARGTSEMLQTVIDVAPQVIITADIDWRVTRWNKAAEMLFGWTAAEIIGQPIPYVPAEQRSEFNEYQSSMLLTRTPQTIETVRCRKDRSRVSVLVSSSTLRDQEQNPIGFIEVVSDLTERKSLEEQLRQSQKMEAIGRLAGGVAHDFNNILTVITASTALLLERVKETEDREDLEAIATSALRASALTRQLLLFSRKQLVNLRPINLNDTVHNMGPMLRRLVRANIQFNNTLSCELPPVTADPSQLEQVIMNLVVNSSDAMPDGGRLSVETSCVDLDEAYATAHPDVKPGRYVQLTVSDTGIGMSAATIEKIFEPFFTTKDVGQGTGLGLATTYAVISQLGGHIRVYSEQGVGTAFKIFLPVSQVPASSDRAPTPAVGSGRQTKPSGITVLLVEDEKPVREVLRRTLVRQGHRILEASDGDSGLAMATSHIGTIDVLVTDIMMPGMNGRVFADVLRAERPDMRVVYMSGYTSETVHQLGLVAPDHAFLQKPFSAAQLDAAIREVMAATKSVLV